MQTFQMVLVKGDTKSYWEFLELLLKKIECSKLSLKSESLSKAKNQAVAVLPLTR